MEPVFTETLQIGIVVRDLEAAMRTYVEDFGIGPWEIFEFDPENAGGLYEHGEPVARSWRLATTLIGGVQWELIEPLDEDGVYARFLAEKGGGVHHIAVASNFDAAVAHQTSQGKKLMLDGIFDGVRVAYLDTDRELGVATEIFTGTPRNELKPTSSYPTAP